MKAVKDDLEKRRPRELGWLLGQFDLEAALERGEWRRAEQLAPDEFRTAEDRRLRARILDLKSKDRSVLLKDRQEAEAEMAGLRQAGGQLDRPPPPLDVDVYE